MKFRRLSLIAMLLAATAATSAMPSSSSWDEEDDDIYYNASKDKSSATQKQTKQAAGNSGYYYTPNTIVNYPDPAGYVPQGSGLDMDVDAYNRRGQLPCGRQRTCRFARRSSRQLCLYAPHRKILEPRHRKRFGQSSSHRLLLFTAGYRHQCLCSQCLALGNLALFVMVQPLVQAGTAPRGHGAGIWGGMTPGIRGAGDGDPDIGPVTPPVGDLHGVRHGVPDGILHPAPDIGPETRPAAHARTIQQVAPPPSDAAPEPSVPEPALPDPATWATTAITVPFRQPIPTLDRHRPAPRAPTA